MTPRLKYIEPPPHFFLNFCQGWRLIGPAINRTNSAPPWVKEYVKCSKEFLDHKARVKLAPGSGSGVRIT